MEGDQSIIEVHDSDSFKPRILLLIASDLFLTRKSPEKVGTFNSKIQAMIADGLASRSGWAEN